MSTMITAKSAAIPARMHFPYARRVARRGYPIRLVEWTNVWWIWRGGLWLRVAEGQAARVVQAGDYDAETLLSWNWTTLPVGCEELTADVPLAELLTVRPYDGLPVAGDALARRCELPRIGETLVPEGWPELGPPKVEGRTVPFKRPAVKMPPMPRAEWGGPEWRPGRVRRVPDTSAPSGPPAPAVALAFTVQVGSWPTTGAGCFNPSLYGPSGLNSALGRLIQGGGVTLDGGEPGVTYDVTIGVRSGETFSATWWSGTMMRGQAVTWTPSFSIGLAVGGPMSTAGVAYYGPVAWGGTFTVWARYAAAGGGASGWVSRAIVVPGLCAPGS